MPEERTISSKRIFKGRIVGLRDDTVELANGRKSQREIVEHAGAVAVIALTKNDEIVLIRQHRKPVEEDILEIPAGLFNKGERLEDAAARELEEETGFLARKITHVLDAYATPGYSTEMIRYFLAVDLKKTSQKTEEDEIISVEIVKMSDAFGKIVTGEIKDNKTIIGITIAEKYLSGQWKSI